MKMFIFICCVIGLYFSGCSVGFNSRTKAGRKEYAPIQQDTLKNDILIAAALADSIVNSEGIDVAKYYRKIEIHDSYYEIIYVDFDSMFRYKDSITLTDDIFIRISRNSYKLIEKGAYQ